MQNGQILSMTEGDIPLFLVRRVWRYQRGNQNPYIEEEQTEEDRVTRTPLKTPEG